MFEAFPTAERITKAKATTKRVVDHLLYVIGLHENNSIIVYSPVLSSQVPASFAANAFNVFRSAIHRFEIVRLCALWDGPDLQKENIPTVIELIDSPDVIETLAGETALHWFEMGGHGVNLSDDEETHELLVRALQRSNEEFGLEQADRARDGLRKAIDDAKSVLNSPELVSIMNFRDKHLAHSLSETRRERKTGPVEIAKFGQERDLLNATVPIVEALYCWVNGSSFSFEDSRKVDQENAKALWETCTFNIST